MVKYSQALALVLSLSAVSSSVAFMNPRSRTVDPVSAMRRPVSASHSLDQYDEDKNKLLREKVESLGQSVTDAITTWDDEAADLDDEARVEIKKRLMRQRLSPAGKTVSLSLKENMGITLCQVETGARVMDQTLNIDTLQYDMNSGASTWETIGKAALEKGLDENFRGLAVKAVNKGGQGYAQGVRPGDILLASSATVGDAMWPKATLEGLKSAIASRKVVSDDLVLQFQPSVSESANLGNQFELSIAKPIGIEIGEDDNGYVVVTGFNENVSKLVRYAVHEGDRIVAVASSLGDTMWPVSTVEGTISACTSRLPGQKVKLRFERPQEVLDKIADRDNTFDGEIRATNPTVTTTVILTDEKRKVLLQRCRDVLKRYSVDSKGGGFVGRHAVPVMIADKVVDAVASASSSFDAPTLSMVMKAYLSCDEPDAALRIFEASVGVKADGSCDKVDTLTKGSGSGLLKASPLALNLYTASSVLHALAMKGDLSSAKRVLAALEGRHGEVDGKLVASWPGVIPDTMCYNIVLSAAAAAPDGLADLRLIFSSMTDGNQLSLPPKDLVSFNTVIGALSNAGKADEAFEVFEQMKRAAIKPDKYTYTSLVKSCSRPIDMQELLYDMKEKGVKPDVVTYNTVIRTLCERLQWYEAKKMVVEMEASGVAPNSMTYGFLMTGLMKAEKYSACLALFESACADTRTIPLTENVHLYTTAISAAASLRNYEKAFFLINRMNVAGVRPNLKTLTAVMCACLASRQSSLAVDVYKQIAEPDSKAMVKGVEAMCLEGLFQEASETLHEQWRTRGSVLNGKQIMQGYDTLMRESLQQGNFPSARSGFTQFLSMGFIPSKAMFQTIIDSLGCAPPRRRRDLAFAKDIPEENFEFLLFVLDSINARNLSCDGSFFSALLLCGSRMGSLRRKLCSLMTEARALTAVDELPTGETIGWEDLLKNYDSYKKSDKTTKLPALRVTVNKAQVKSVLFAEQEVTYNGRKASSKTSKGAKRPVFAR